MDGYNLYIYKQTHVNNLKLKKLGFFDGKIMLECFNTVNKGMNPIENPN